MAVVVASTSTTSETANASNLTITKPSGLAAGDMMVAFLFKGGSAGYSLTGWTAVGSDAAADSMRMTCLVKKADSSDVSASDFTFVCGTQVARVGYLLRITGDFSVGSITDYIVSDTDSNVAISSGVVTLPGGVTPLATSPLLLLAAGSGKAGFTSSSFSAYATANNNPTWTEIGDTYTGTGASNYSVISAVASASYSPKTTTGSYSVTSAPGGGATDNYGGKLLAITEVTNFTGTFTHLEVSPAFYATTPEAGTLGTHDHLSVSPTLNDISGKGSSPTNWSNEAPASTAWVNEQQL